MQPLKEVAQKWHDLGLKIVPVELGLDAENKKTVRCLWKWKRDPYPGFTCLDWRGANGFGITLGRTSHGYIVCVDCDHDAGQDAYSSFVKAFPDLTKTYIERTPNGFHLFVYIDKPLDASNINIKTKNGTELHVNGLIFMAPTKYHGREYEIYNASEIIKISDFYQQYQKAFDTPKKQVDIAYVLNGVPEGERNEAAIQLASWYRRRKKLDKQETKKKLSDWNTKNNPPLLREELQNIIENAYRNTTPYHYYFINEPYEKHRLDPSISEFWSRRGFEPVRFAEHLMIIYHFKTMRDNGTIYVYNESTGTYEPTGEVTIKEEMSHLLGEETRSRFFTDVKFYIQGKTGFDRPKTPTKKIATFNGILTPTTGEFSSSSPSEFVTVQIPVTYEPSTRCVKIQKFLTEVVGEKRLPLIQELFGYCLYLEYPFHRAFMFVGEGANGKSTLLNLIKNFLGKENTSDLSLSSLCYNRFAPAQLYNKLADLCPDLPDKSLTKTGMFKMLTGGDTIAAEQKFKDLFSFRNYAKLIFSANKIPETSDDTIAFFRRWIIISCNNYFSPGKADPHILNKICTPTEMSGLLNWALEGLKRLLQQGSFSEDPLWETKRTQYIRGSNSAKAYIEEKLEKSKNHDDTIPKTRLYQAYVVWCKEQNLPSKRQAEFTQNLLQYLPKVEECRLRREGGRVLAWKYVKLKEGGQGGHPSLFNTGKLAEKKE